VPHRVWNLRRDETNFRTQQGLLRRGRASDEAEEIDAGSHRGRTRGQLYEEAKDLNIRGRSMMNKQELRGAVERKTGQ
jgi:hypothetical protein